MEVTLGGDRLGSGNKQKQYLHEYDRASFNQEQDWKSSMAPGVLYPFLCIPMTNGDSMDIDLDAFVRTLPTKGPLFGSFKLQADIFSIPMRLYNGILHNNPLDIGLKMNQIYTPKLYLTANKNATRVKGLTDYDWQIHPTSLMKYLGLSGVMGMAAGVSKVGRKINAIPALAYYDIFKNYYANKQEQYAYVITPGVPEETAQIDAFFVNYWGRETIESNPEWLQTEVDENVTFNWTNENGAEKEDYISLTWDDNDLEIDYWETFEISFDGGINWYTGREAINKNMIEPFPRIGTAMVGAYLKNPLTSSIKWRNKIIDTESKIILSQFDLKNIDDMRYAILAKTTIGSEFIIANSQEEERPDWEERSGTDGTGLPYSALTNYFTESENAEISWNSYTQNGLVVKTYQSDIFQNWINTEWIEGENGIAALSAVAINEDTLQIDALNLAQKVYNMLNRIAISGGTYEDWQEAAYTQEAVRKAESPIYEGGMSAEVMFEEVISSAETNVEGDFQALGSLGGKGTMVGQKGGHNIHVKAREPIFVMGIVSLTPRICYTQGNEWYLTDLDTFDDLHKPALDQIGFQDLLVEQFAWWGTQRTTHQQNPISRQAIGKIVAWSNYMTAVDKAYGDFARPEGKGFMALARNYSINGDDYTTYIDPAKFNYAFAYNDLAAQNFWVQIHSKVTTRRVMSAHQIPNL